MSNGFCSLFVGGEDQSVSVEMGVDVGVDVDSNTELAGEQAKSQLPSGERRKRVSIIAT